MPALDAARLRVRLSPAHLAVLTAVVDDAEVRPEHADAANELREAGLLREDGPHPTALGVVRALSRAQLLVDVEVSGPGGVTGQGVAISGDVGCLLSAWPGEVEGEYALVAPGMAVPALALVAGLVPAPADPERRAVEAPLRLVDGALAAFAEASGAAAWARARSAAVDVLRAELDPATATALGELVADLRRAVRFTVSTPVAPDREPRGFTVLDAGALGYWLRVVPQDPLSLADLADPDLRVRLEPTTPRALWQELADLFGGLG